MADTAPLPAHPPQTGDDTDEELTDEQVRELLTQTAERMRAKPPQSATEAPFKLPKLNPGYIADTYSTTQGAITKLDGSKLLPKKEQALANGIKKIEDPVQLKKQKKEEKRATAGSDWFNLPRTEMTPELRRDLQLLKMRNVLDSKRHYKKSDSKSDVPAFSQVGTIIEGPTEFYSSRINKKDRHQTLVEEVLAQEEQSGKFKSKYENIITSKKSGKKGFYKALQEKRRKGKVIKP
ncbi:nucleolus protein-like protein required for cell viability [Bimuria novae-zelandiae CBS 107.79]|uniref:Nucleolus protein-like protein required for cell viability n=1 Tax=Bimuria novae-zelandiae CBS 107.79 TaxID=1447943 RepID=A0A6A5V430_9PLEO|nr:nucleolus protein-like protein required for cell viability [Bimuria novae-zelandiae CBS 107.79]